MNSAKRKRQVKEPRVAELPAESITDEYDALVALPEEGLLAALEADILAAISLIFESSLTVKKVGKSRDLKFFYPRVFAARRLFPALKPFPVTDKMSKSRNAMSATAIWQRSYTLDSLAPLKALFPGLFDERLYGDERGNINFDPTEGEAAGGKILPLVDRLRLCSLTYNWRVQTCEISFFLRKMKCVFEGPVVTWQDLPF